MNEKEIRSEAFQWLRKRWDNVFVLSLFETALVFAFIAIELAVYSICVHFEIDYSLSLTKLVSTPMNIFMLIFRVMMIIFALLPELFIIRRFYLDILAGRDLFETRRYIIYNTRRIHPRITLTCFVTAMLKLFALTPMLIGIYGIYYFGRQARSDDLSTFVLFMFMLSMGFTVVWLGLFVHYCISLSLTKYIMSLNPRANIFDACDLSVKLMEGNHTRYIQLMLSFAKFLPLLVLVYPLFIFVPYYRASQAVLAEEIMGSYWHDKLPAMVKRWNKYAR